MPGYDWSLIEERSLIRQVLEDRKLPQIVIEGRSKPSINNKRRLLRKRGVFGDGAKPRQVRFWTATELDLLRRFVGFGLSAMQIAKKALLNSRTKDSIGKAMGRTGLGDPDVKRRAKEAIRLSKERREAFKEFLVGSGKQMSTQSIAQMWSVTERMVRRNRRKLGVALGWKEARSFPEHKERKQRMVAKIKEGNQRRSRKWLINKARELNLLCWKMTHTHVPHKRLACRVCKVVWFTTRDFFPARWKRNRKGEVKVYLVQTCIICKALRRRQSV